MSLDLLDENCAVLIEGKEYPVKYNNREHEYIILIDGDKEVRKEYGYFNKINWTYKEL